MTQEQKFNDEFSWGFEPYPIPTDKPLASTVTALCWNDVWPETGKHKFRVTNRTGGSHTVTLDKNYFRTIRGLMKNPIKAASLARIGAYVQHLRHDFDIEIHCQRYDGNAYGAYYLVSRVELLEEEAA